MDIKPTDATLGALVTDIDLRRLDDKTFEAIETAWHAYAVLIFPGQHLSDEAHIAFTKRFGRLESGLKRTQKAGLALFSNITADGTIAPPSSLQVRFQVGNTHWHSDSSYKRVGAKASLLAAHVVPDDGGETEWADMRAAYDALDCDMKTWLDNKIAVHSYRFSHTWHGGLEFLTDNELAELPAVDHPIIRTHPATGREILFVGRHASHIVGEDVARSRQLLRDLTEAAGQPPRTYKHKWRAGDIVIWDNRCVLHRGHPWPDDQRRVMARSTVAGDASDNEWAMPEGA